LQRSLGGARAESVTMSRISEKIAAEVEKLIEPVLEEKEYELVEVEYVPIQGKWALRIFADKEGGITLDDCVILSREIGDLIDVKDLVPHEYVLEVSSPGLNRSLKKEKDFVWALGKQVKVRMRTPVERRRSFVGYLREFREGFLHLEMDSDVVMLPLKDVEKANLMYDFGS